MDASTLLIVFLLVSAATLASYALSHWSAVRGSTRGVGWAATSVGTTLLLTAAVIVVLTLVFRALLWSPNPEAASEPRESATSLRKASTQAITGLETSPREATASATPTNRTPRSGANEQATTSTAAARSETTQPIKPGESHSSEQTTLGRNAASVPVFAELDPWAATRCVIVYNPDASEPTRWKIENGCDTPVGIVLSTCSAASTGCNTRDLIFPAALQRPITQDEQTVLAPEVRYVACFVATSPAIQMIGEPGEARSSRAWREQFDAVRAGDGCLMRVQSWTEQARRTRVPIDTLIGIGPQFTSQ